MAAELATLLSGPVPVPFVYLHHPHHPTSTIFREALPSNCIITQVDTIELYSARLLFSGILYRLAKILGRKDEIGELGNWDSFVRTLKMVWDEPEGKMNGKGKGKQKATDMEADRRLVIVITKSERLKNVLGPGWSVMTRLAEMVS